MSSVESYGRILSVDNESTFRQQINNYLEDSGFVTFEASTNQEALRLFREKKPDVVLSSLQMSGENGLEFLDAIRKESPETPIIVISYPDSVENILEALHLGAWDYIIKPIKNLAVMEHAVCRALERGRLVTENKRYRMELEKKNSELSRSLGELKEDQEAGKSVQQQLLPKPEMTYGTFQFSQKVLPSLYLSGDFVDYFEINEYSIGFYMIDVSGHGASSAFVTVMVKNLIERILLKYQMERDESILFPNKVLKQISDAILQLKLGKYLTMIYCLLDKRTNELQYSIGGHYPSPILVSKEEARYLDGSGFAVGVFKQAEFNTIKCQLPNLFTLCLLSDGVFEVIEGKNLKAKEDALLNSIKHSQNNIKSILDSIGAKHDNGFPDDIAILLVKRTEYANK